MMETGPRDERRLRDCVRSRDPKGPYDSPQKHVVDVTRLLGGLEDMQHA